MKSAWLSISSRSGTWIQRRIPSEIPARLEFTFLYVGKTSPAVNILEEPREVEYDMASISIEQSNLRVKAASKQPVVISVPHSQRRRMMFLAAPQCFHLRKIMNELLQERWKKRVRCWWGTSKQDWELSERGLHIEQFKIKRMWQNMQLLSCLVPDCACLWIESCEELSFMSSLSSINQPCSIWVITGCKHAIFKR